MKLAEIAQLLDARLAGDSDVVIDGIAAVSEAGPGHITFLNDAKYADQVAQTQAAAVILPEDFSGTVDVAGLYVGNVDDAVEKLLAAWAGPGDAPAPGIHGTAVIADSAQIGPGVAIGAHVVIGENAQVGAQTVLCPGCVIGRDVTIGEKCHIASNVVVGWGCIVADRVIIHANCTLGADGFGYRLVDGRHKKIPHVGIVEIQADVEIGANTCIDRAKFGRTVIGRGTKIDNLVQIAHNVRTGEHCIIVSQTGIAGSARLGNYVVLAGQCGVADHVTIGDGVMAGATTTIYHDVEPKAKLVGAPALPHREWFRMYSAMRELPSLLKEWKKNRRQSQ